MVNCYDFKDEREKGQGEVEREKERWRDFWISMTNNKNRIFSTHTQKLHAGKRGARKSKTNYLIF